MKKITSLFVLIIFIKFSFAQSILKRDPEIDAMVKEVSSDSLKSICINLFLLELEIH